MKPSVVNEGFKILAGRETMQGFGAFLITLALGDALLTKEVLTMDLLYIPDGWLMPVCIVLGVFAIIGPVLSAWHLKNKSKHQFDDFLRFYGATMIADMLVTPSVTLLVMSIIAQRWIPDMPAEMFVCLLPFVLLAVSYYALIVMNEGFTSAWEQIKKVNIDIKNVVDDIKKQQ